MPAPSTPQTIPDVTEDSETGSGSGLGRSRDKGIFDQLRANDAEYFCFGSIAAGCLRQHLSDHVLLESDTYCAQGEGVRCEVPQAVLSPARPDPSQRDRFPGSIAFVQTSSVAH